MEGGGEAGMASLAGVFDSGCSGVRTGASDWTGSA